MTTDELQEVLATAEAEARRAVEELESAFVQAVRELAIEAIRRRSVS